VAASLFAGFAAYAILYFAGPENQALAIASGLGASGLLLLGLWRRSRMPAKQASAQPEPAPQFDAVMAWADDDHGPVLEIVIRNVGTKRGAIQGLYFRTWLPGSDGGHWHQWDLEPLHAAFSAVLDTDEVTRPIEVALGRIPPSLEALIRALSQGDAEVTIVSTRGEEHVPVPAIGQGPPPPRLKDLTSPPVASRTNADLGRELLGLAKSLQDWKDQFHFRAPPLQVLHGEMSQEDWERSRNREMQSQHRDWLAPHWPPLYDQAVERGITDARLESLRLSPPARPEDFDELHDGLKSVAMRLLGTSPHVGYEQ